MIGITAKLANVLLQPLQSLDLILETIVGATSLDNLLRGKEAIGTNAVVEVYNDNVVVACFDQTGAVVIGIRV